MTTGIYLSAMTQDSGKSLIALGLADSLVKRADRVGFFRPIFKGETASDDLAHYVRGSSPRSSISTRENRKNPCRGS